MPSADAPHLPRRIAVLSSASGSGKTVFARELAARHGLPYHELDALHHGPNWTEPTAAEFQAIVAPIAAKPAWVIDGSYRGKLGDLVLSRAELVIWLDLPRRVWVPRLGWRTIRRIARREELWNGNRETVRNVLVGRDSLFRFAWRTYPERRRRYPAELAPFSTMRLGTRTEVRSFRLPGEGAT
jgi:adenylate kinase family enzyme